MALLFSHVRISTPDGNEADLLVSSIPREFDDFGYYTRFEDFLDSIEKDAEISVHAEACLYGSGEAVKASNEEVAYLTLRMNADDRFLTGHCDNIESVDFTCSYSPDKRFGMDRG